jgi:hypothetical protein
MSNPAPVYIAVECRIEDAAAREAAHQAFDGFARGDEPEARAALLQAPGVDLDTPFDLGSEWLVESADATSDGSFRLAVESCTGHSDDFIESFLLVLDALGAEEVSADVSDGQGSDMRLQLVDGAVVYLASTDDEDTIEMELDDMELEGSY